jgi:hypothetical protein
MSKLMIVLGIVLALAGVALALVGIKNPAMMQVYGLTLETAAILFTGGVLALGLGGAIDALRAGVPMTTASAAVEAEKPMVAAAPVEVSKVEVAKVDEPVAPKAAEEATSRIKFNPFARKTVEAAGTAVAAGAAAATVEASEPAAAAVPAAKSAVDDTIAALEQAKADIANAVGGIATVTEPPAAEEAEEPEDEEADDDAADGELYVIEEREIRGRPARILSDNTVEAETDEGWMRFENLEHLNEYLDAMGEPA